MSGEERISDKDFSEWVKQVEHDAASPEKIAPKHKPPEEQTAPSSEQTDNQPDEAPSNG